MMKPLKPGLGIAFVIALLLITACPGLADAPPAAVKYPPVPEWGNLGAVDIIPCPKRIKIEEARLPLANLAIRYLPDADGQLKTGAGEIAARITGLGGAAPQIASSEAGALVSSLAGPAVVIGYGKGALPFKDIPSSYRGVSVWDEEQGYVIAVKKAGGADVIVVWGTDAAGAFYGCITLTKLIGGSKAEGVYARQAEIIDWPDFKRRQTSGMEAAKNSITKKRFDEAVAIMKQAIRHAADIKCNSIEVGFFGDAQVEYLSEDMAAALKQVKDYARAYGVRFAFFFSTSIASQDRAEKDPRYKDIPCIRGKYMTWSNDELLDESLQRLKDQVATFKGQADYGFHLPDMNEGGWALRAESDRRRWGDDRAKGDAYFADKTYKAVKEADPDARVQFVFYHYSVNLDYAGNAKSQKYFADLSAYVPGDLLFSKREGSIESFQSWRKNIKQPLAIYWSPNTFWGARAFAPDMAFLKTTYHSNRHDLVMDCLTAGSRPILVPSQYAFAEYAWNVNAPGSGIWRQDPAGDQTNSATGVPGDYVGVRSLHASGVPFRRWIDVEGRGQPGEMMHALLERICRLVYGGKAAPAMAEALRNSCPTAREYWSDDPEIAKAQYAAAQKAFETLIPLWDRKDDFADQYELYRQLTKTYADLHVLMKCNLAAAEINALLGKAREAGINRVQSAREAAAACEKYMAAIGPDKKYLKDLYNRYGFEGLPWVRLLQPQYGKYADIAELLSQYEKEFKQSLADARLLEKAPAQAKGGFAFARYCAKPPAVDADPADWELANPIFIDYRCYPGHVKDHPNKNNADSSAIFYIAWDTNYFYVLAKVIDDEVRFTRDSGIPDGDAVELWINNAQFGMANNSKGVPIVEAYSGTSPEGVLVAVKKTEKYDFKRDFELLGKTPPDMEGQSGYIIEAAIPLEKIKAVHEGITPDKAETFWFAIGMDDADATGGAQTFFPATYKHLYCGGGKMTDFAEARLVRGAPIAFELVAPEKSDRTVQDGTDTFIKCRVRIKSPVPLTDLKVACLRVTAEGQRKPVLLKGIPGFMEKDKTWESAALEFNVGPAAPEARLIFRVTASECGFEVEKTLK